MRKLRSIESPSKDKALAKDLIRYDLLTQDAMRQIVRHVMEGVARDGRLPGEHHFYIGFLTNYRGVRVSPLLREQYPEEMTVVIQHQFTNLLVTDTGFEVTLEFGGRPERLSVPFDAITQFFDPSVNFGLKFELAKAAEEAPATKEKSGAAPATASEGRGKQKSGPKGAGSEPQSLPPRPDNAPGKEAPKDGKSADVVSLDKFRKK